MLNPEDVRSTAAKIPSRPAHESIATPESERDDKAEQIANKAAIKAQDRMKNAEDVRGPFSNFGQ